MSKFYLLTFNFCCLFFLSPIAKSNELLIPDNREVISTIKDALGITQSTWVVGHTLEDERSMVVVEDENGDLLFKVYKLIEDSWKDKPTEVVSLLFKLSQNHEISNLVEAHLDEGKDDPSKKSIQIKQRYRDSVGAETRQILRIRFVHPMGGSPVRDISVALFDAEPITVRYEVSRLISNQGTEPVYFEECAGKLL